MMNRKKGYTTVAIILHWITVVIILPAFIMGAYMEDLQLSPFKLKLYSYHKWLGVSVFLLAVSRLIWRSFNPAPPLPEKMPSWEKALAHIAHYALYALVALVPLTGWLMSSAHGFQTVYLGVIPIPDLIGKDKELEEALEVVHFALNKLLLITIIGHALAALKHHFIDRDDVLIRMIKRGS